MAVVASAGRIGGRKFGPPERAFLALALVVTLIVGLVMYSVEDSNPSVTSLYEGLREGTYEELLPAEFVFKRFADSPSKDYWRTGDSRYGIALFGGEAGKGSISYSVSASEQEAQAGFDDHLANDRSYESITPPEIRHERTLEFLGSSGVATPSFCTTVGYATECIGVDGNVVVIGQSHPTGRGDIGTNNRMLASAKLLLKAGLTQVEKVR